jgi:uncharacterized protein (DUF58 family)
VKTGVQSIAKALKRLDSGFRRNDVKRTEPNFSIKSDRQDRPSSISSGYLFHNGSLLVVGGILLISAWEGLVTLVVPLGLVLAAALLAKTWARLSLVQVSCKRTVREKRLFPGDRTDVRLELANRKILPLPWVEIEDAIPVQLLEGNFPPSAQRPECASLLRSSSLLGYRRAKWKFSLRAGKRGFYSLGPLRLTSGDLFGFYRRSLEIPQPEFIVVYPRIFPLGSFAPPSLFPLGDIRSEKRIFQDPLRPIGLREYQPFDSLRHIHWKASVRCQCLQVKIFEPTVTLQAVLFLGVDSYHANDGGQDEDFEWGVSLAAFIANHFVAQGIPTGLFSNGRLIDSGQPVQILPGGSREQTLMILVALAKLTSRVDEPLESFLSRERRALAQGSTLVFVLHRISSPLIWQLQELKEAGYKLAVLLSGDQETSGLDETVIRKWARPPAFSTPFSQGGPI